MIFEFIVSMLIAICVLGIVAMCRSIANLEPQNKETLGEEVQEFLGDVQEYQENVRNKKAQFPILYDKAHAVLGYLLMIGEEDETIAWARHMYYLGFMHETMVYAVFSQYGNVFEEEESIEPIREYAIEVLSNLIEGKDVFENNEKEDIRQLVAEMQALGWYSPNDSDDFENFVQNGADALIRDHLDEVKELL